MDEWTMADGRPAEAGAVRVALAGDSTVQAYDAERTGQRGWGQLLGAYLDGVAVMNLAAGGRSSKSFLLEGRWSRVVAASPDVVVIQFGHNDAAGKGEHRETLPGEPPGVLPAAPAAGWRRVDYYRHNLRTYVAEARVVGATPVLVTPMERLEWSGPGVLQGRCRPYAEATRAVAASLNVACIDLNAFSVEHLTAVGEAGALRYHTFDGKVDRTHFSEDGARLYAERVARGLAGAVPALRGRLRAAAGVGAGRGEPA